jgi:hypothetical protein
MTTVTATPLLCPHCSAPLQVHPKAVFLACSYCGTHLQVEGGEGDRRLALDQGATERAPVGLPTKFAVERLGNRLTLRWRWWTPALFFMLFFCIAWDSFLVFWYSMAVGMDAPWIFVVFPIVHVAVGVGITYSTLAGFINSTTVEVGQGNLRIAHGPLPWQGNQLLETADVDQLFCTRAATKSEDSDSLSYNVMVRTKSGRNIKLVSRLEELDQALYIEQEIERHLGVADRAMSGEVSR